MPRQTAYSQHRWGAIPSSCSEGEAKKVTDNEYGAAYLIQIQCLRGYWMR
jgi:hypothetical protein